MNTLHQYFRIARPDHWFKNIFMFPGIVFALLFSTQTPEYTLLKICVGFISTCLIASANYVINEWLDRNFDKFHPTKKNRPSVVGNLRSSYVTIEYILLVVCGLSLALLVSLHFFIFSAILLVLGIIYNVPPSRTKDRVYLDVLSESLNNPIRFLLGWSIIETHFLPPSSILLAYWMGGAFLMAIKRFAEYRYISDPVKAGLYRQSFRYYTEDNLLISSFFYALSSAFFLGVFLIKYRIEYLVCFPFLSILFAWYLKIGLSAESTAQTPEKLYTEKTFVGYIIFLCLLFLVLSFIDLPWLSFLLEKTSFESP